MDMNAFARINRHRRDPQCLSDWQACAGSDADVPGGQVMNINQLIDRLIIIKDRLANQSERDAINDAVAMINDAQNAMRPLGYKLAGILDASLPLIEAEANQEAAREQGKAMRCITWKGRAAGAREAIAKAESLFGYDIPPEDRQ